MISGHNAGPAGSLGRLARFRDGFRGCLNRWSDALFELADAVLSTDDPVPSLMRLCLEPEFRRGHGSLYQGLSSGRVDTDRLRELLVAHRPQGWPLVFAVDASTVERCDAETAPQRGYYPSKHSAGQPIVRRRSPSRHSAEPVRTAWQRGGRSHPNASNQNATPSVG